MRCNTQAALALVLVVATAGVSGQEVPAVRSEIVRLDVVVTDAKGAPVLDLTREDFAVLEDGKPQAVTNFEPAHARGLSTSAPKPTEPAAPVAPADRPTARQIVVVVDDLHLARDAVEPAKQALLRFLSEQVSAEDEIAVVTTSSPGGLLALTRDRTAVRGAIGRIGSRESAMAAARGAQMTPAQAELILRGDQNALRLATRSLMDEPGSTLSAGSPRATVESTDGATPAGLDPGEKAAAREAQREATAVLAGALRFSEMTLVTVDGVLRGLSSLPGRKLCLLVSDGFLVGKGTSEERTELLRRVTDAATRSGAVVYALDARGLTPGGADASVSGPVMDPGLRERVGKLEKEESRETLQRLAHDTGGILVRDTNDLGAGLGRMLADNEAFYLVAYEPTNGKRDGRFRKIELRLPRHPDFEVRTRAGYVAPDDRKQGAKASSGARATLPSLVASPQGLDEAAVRAALGAPVPANGVPVLVTADYLDLPPEGPQAIVQVHVAVARLRWQKVDDRRKTDVEVLGGVYDANGGPVGMPFGRSFALDLGPAEYGRAVEDGLRYAHRLPLKPGRYEVRIIAREPALAPLGGASQWLDVPDLGAKTLTLSSLFVSATSGASPGAGEGQETLRDAQLRRQFTKSDTLYFQVYVYNAVADPTGATDVVLQAQIRSGKDTIAASKPQAVTFQQKDGLPLPQGNGMSLESLAPGDYELRVVVVDRKANATAFRDVVFKLQ
jgi:VWFA-related protein